MHRWLPAIDYPPEQAGFWSPVTSTINWCEEVRRSLASVKRSQKGNTHISSKDYYATIYSAEIVNSFTNLLFMWLGIKGIVSCVKAGHDKIFLLSFIGYLVVGSGSFLFHSTLKCT